MSNIGGMAALIGGALAQRSGWSAAFAASSSGMLICLVTMRYFERSYIDPFVIKEGPNARLAADSDVDTTATSPLTIIIPLGAYLIACCLTYQAYGFVGLFSAKSVDRTAFGYAIPPSWFVAINTATIILCSATFVALWRRKLFGYDWRPERKLAAAFIIVAAAFVLLVGAALESRSGHLASPLRIAGAMVLMGLCELLVNPTVMSMILGLARRTRHGLFIGIVSGAAGFGAWLSGLIGAAPISGAMVTVFTTLAAVAAFAALVLMISHGGPRRKRTEAP